MIGRWLYMLMDVLQTAGPAVLWLYGGWLVLHGQATVGTVATFIVVLAGRLDGAIGQVGNLHVNVTGSLALFQRIFTLLDLPAEVIDHLGARPLQRVRGAVAFDRVTFAYRPELRPALEEVSFRVEPGQLVALLGPIGTGRSTAVSLVPRFHDPQQGQVLVDGHDVHEVTLDALRPPRRHRRRADRGGHRQPARLDAVITGTVNTGRVDRRPLLGAVVRTLTG